MVLILMVLYLVHSKELFGVVATDVIEGIAATLCVRSHRFKCPRPGRKQATATEELIFIYLIYNRKCMNVSSIYIYIYIYIYI
jgi:hypothetical protein